MDGIHQVHGRWRFALNCGRNKGQARVCNQQDRQPKHGYNGFEAIDSTPGGTHYFYYRAIEDKPAVQAQWRGPLTSHEAWPTTNE
jgi:hypothetical protein